MFEKLGYATAAFSIMFVEITSALIFYPAAKHDLTFIASICWFYNCFGAQLGLYPLVTDTLFKSKGAFSYSILFSAFSLSSVLILQSAEVIQKWAGGEKNLVYVLCFVAVIPAYNIWVLHKRIKKVNEKHKKEEQGEAEERDVVSRNPPIPIIEEEDEGLA